MNNDIYIYGLLGTFIAACWIVIGSILISKWQQKKKMRQAKTQFHGRAI